MARVIKQLAKPPGRVLLIRLSALGDVVNCLPAIEALREAWPDTTLDAATEEMGSKILEGHPLLDRVLCLRRKSWRKAARDPDRWNGISAEFAEFVEGLRRHPYDLVIDFQGNLRSLLLSWFVRAPVRITHHPSEVREHAWVGARTPRTPSGRVTRARKHLHLVGAIAGVRTEPRARSRRNPSGPILLHPYASAAGKLKEWPERHFAQLAEKLQQEGHSVLIAWGPGEREGAERIAAGSAGKVSVAPPTPSVESMRSLIWSAKLVVAADTGPLHAAAVDGIPVVGIYGPKDPKIYAPWSHHHRVVQSRIPCAPCKLRRCPHSVCMELIPVGEVVAAVQDLLAELDSDG